MFYIIFHLLYGRVWLLFGKDNHKQAIKATVVAPWTIYSKIA